MNALRAGELRQYQLFSGSLELYHNGIVESFLSIVTMS